MPTAPFEIYSKLRVISVPDILKAAYDFAVYFGGYADTAVFQGFLNKSTLPPNDNNFCIVQLLGKKTLATNVKQINQEDDTYTSYAYMQYSLQIDVYGNTQAESLEKMLKMQVALQDDTGVSFWNDRGISLLYADAPQNLTYADESGQYVPRQSIRVQLSAWDITAMDVQSFSVIVPRNKPVI